MDNEVGQPESQIRTSQEKEVISCHMLLRSPALIFGSDTWGWMYNKEFGLSLSWVLEGETKSLELPN